MPSGYVRWDDDRNERGSGHAASVAAAWSPSRDRGHPHGALAQVAGRCEYRGISWASGLNDHGQGIAASTGKALPPPRVYSLRLAPLQGLPDRVAAPTAGKSMVSQKTRVLLVD